MTIRAEGLDVDAPHDPCDGAISGPHYHRDTPDGEEVVRLHPEATPIAEQKGSGMTNMDEVRAALEEIVPALMAAGLTKSDLRAINDETLRRMGEGGSVISWLDTMCRVSEDVGGKTASRMFKIAVFRYHQQRMNKT